MWEMAIVVGSENVHISKFIFKALKTKVEEVGGVLTSFEQAGKISILVACQQLEKARLQYHVSAIIASVICTVFKEKFLQERLELPPKNALEIFTFKKALVSFDKETDKFLVGKFLVLEKTLELESFFHFRLRALKEKWLELVSIANENANYLLGEDSFVELLKFLVDNIEVMSDRVFVRLQNGTASVFDAAQNMHELLCDASKEELVEFLFAQSPRQIEWSADVPEFFLEKVFSRRIVYATMPKLAGVSSELTEV